jgi:predicted DNA-binding transcriptional regulator YafY
VSERDFDPYGLAYRGGRWYAVGMCHLRRDVRSFRLDRVQSVEALTTSFERPAGFDALEYLKHSVATLPRAHAVEVLLMTDLQTAQRELFSAFGVLEWKGNCVLLRSQADDLFWFAQELARLPFGFEIVKPAALRDSVVAVGERLIAMARR